jgi:citronellol/citronellal dehydrogenase
MTDRSLTGAVAVVTGSARGAGREIALALAREGARVVVADRTDKAFMLPGTIYTVADEITAGGGTAMPFQVDLRHEDQIAALRDAVLAEYGTADIVINNAGIQYMAPVVDVPVERWDQVMAVNSRATFLVCKAFLPALIAKRDGAILNISSIAGRGPMPNMSPYAAAKAAIDYFTLALAEEVREANIAVNSLAPTWQVDTEGVRHLYRDEPEALAQAEPAAHYAKVAVWLVKQPASEFTGQLTWSRQLAAQYGICREWCCAPRGPVVGGPTRVQWELSLPIAPDAAGAAPGAGTHTGEGLPGGRREG